MTIMLVGYADEEGSLKLLRKANHSWSCYIQKDARHQQTAPVYADFTSQNHRFSENKALTILQVESSLCAWEWMLDYRDTELLKSYFDNMGTPAMRHCSMQAGDIARRVHDYMEAQGFEFVGAYDWEFLPSVLEKIDWESLIKDNQYAAGNYQPDLHEIFVTMVAADKARHADPTLRHFKRTKLDTWLELCTKEADAQWGYANLIVDHEEKTEHAYHSGQSPYDFVKWLGEKYDLTPKENTL